jgi:hypothetical protein
MLALASTVILGFFETFNQDSFLYPSKMGPPLRRGEGSVFQRRPYVCSTVVSARVYPRRNVRQLFFDIWPRHGPHRKHRFQQFFYWMFSEPFSSKGRPFEPICHNILDSNLSSNTRSPDYGLLVCDRNFHNRHTRRSKLTIYFLSLRSLFSWK